MYIDSNNILMRIFKLNGLNLKETGLYYQIKNTEYEFFISNDQEKICKLIDLDANLIVNANYEDFFNMVCESKYFYKNKFIEDCSKGECKILGLFSDFLKKNDIVSKNREHIELGHLISYFKEEDFGNQLSKFIYIIVHKAEINQKFSGKTILTLRPDYDKLKLNITMPFFKQNMEKVDFEYFILTSTLEEIVTKFEEVTNHLI